MMTSRWIKLGAIAGLLWSVVAVIVSDLHTAPDLVITLAQLRGAAVILPQGFAFPFRVTGTVAEPILVVTAYLLGVGFITTWHKTGDKLGLVVGVVTLIYGTTEVFAAYADIQYARVLETLQSGGGDLSVLIPSGTLRGISALFVGIMGGLILFPCVAFYFRRKHHTIGVIGALLAFISILVGIPVKALANSMWTETLMTLFLLLMCLKSVGAVVISGALYQEADAEQEAPS